MKQFTLHDLESLTGIKSDTIRMWEQRYRITTPKRTATNRRWYNDDDLRRLINISILNRSGVKISDIARMTSEVLEEKSSDLAGGSTSTDILSDSLLIATTRYDETAINEIMLQSVINKGFEKTFSLLIFPFLKRIGVLWHTGSVIVGAEHFISNIFRRKLISAFDNISTVLSSDGKKILMFLPEGEYHELGLLYYAYIARNLGHEVLYLGQSTPISAVNETSEVWAPEIIITGALTGLSVKDHIGFIQKLSNSLSGKKILLAGSLAETAKKMKNSTIFACFSAHDLKMLIK